MGAGRPNNESWTYKYDRIDRQVGKSSGTAASQKEWFIYDGSNLLAILDGNNDAKQIYTTSLKIDEPLEVRATNGTERFLHAEVLGSIRVITSTSAINVESYEYQAYGLPRIKDESGSLTQITSAENRFLYTGKYLDAGTLLQNNEHRHLDLLTGIFVSEDPLGIDGGLNAYRYALNNPLRHVDPKGLSPAEEQFAQFARCVEQYAVSNVIGKPATMVTLATTAVPKEAVGMPVWWGASRYTSLSSGLQIGLKRCGLMARNSQWLRGFGRAVAPIMTPVTLAEGAMDIGAIAFCTDLVYRQKVEF